MEQTLLAAVPQAVFVVLFVLFTLQLTRYFVSYIRERDSALFKFISDRDTEWRSALEKRDAEWQTSAETREAQWTKFVQDKERDISRAANKFIEQAEANKKYLDCLSAGVAQNTSLIAQMAQHLADNQKMFVSIMQTRPPTRSGVRDG